MTLLGIEAVHSFESLIFLGRFVHSFQHTYTHTRSLAYLPHLFSYTNLANLIVSWVPYTLCLSARYIYYPATICSSHIPLGEIYPIYLILDVTATALLLIELPLAKENGRGVAYATSPWHGHGQE